jgi:hypothetical protein
MVCLGFGKLFHGMGMQMTTDGAGVYYKQLRSLNVNSQLIGDVGLHFDNSKPQIDIFGYDNNFQNTFLDIAVGYRYELFKDQLIGPIRPIFIMGTGGMSDLKSFSKDNIGGIWMINYMLGLGVQFYNRMILNEFILKFSHTKAMQSHVAFQLAFYWKY